MVDLPITAAEPTGDPIWTDIMAAVGGTVAALAARDAVRTLRGRRHATPPGRRHRDQQRRRHPRGAQLGTQLISRLLAELDRDGLGAQLDAGSLAVAAWYTDLGFLSAPQYPHSLHMYRPPAAEPSGDRLPE
jgi:hypothetical protein